MKLEIELDVPPEVIDAGFERAVKEDAILRLFADRKIPSGHAARLLGLNRIEFLRLTEQRGIPHVVYTAEDFREDRNVMEGLKEEIQENVRRAGVRRLE
mgnify:FL=1